MQDCQAKHALRVNYQAAIWRRSLQACPEIPNPKGHGWELESDHDQQFLTIDWMTGSPAPEAVLELMSCKCSSGCKLPLVWVS